MLATGSTPSDAQIQATAYASESGATAGSDGSVTAAGGGWLHYSKVNFGSGTTALQMQIAAAQQSGLKIQIRVDGVNGQILGTVRPATPQSKSQVRRVRIRKTSGVHDLYLVFVGQKGQVSLNWLQLTGTSVKKK